MCALGWSLEIAGVPPGQRPRSVPCATLQHNKALRLVRHDAVVNCGAARIDIR